MFRYSKIGIGALVLLVFCLSVITVARMRDWSLGGQARAASTAVGAREGGQAAAERGRICAVVGQRAAHRNRVGVR